jgi:hypothetical protein
MRKRVTSLLVIVFILATAAVPVLGGGIHVATKSKDQVSILENTEITGQVDGNIISVLGDVSVDVDENGNGKVNGHVMAVFGEISVNSRVSGHVVNIFGKTELK